MMKQIKKELDGLYVAREKGLRLQREIIAICRGAIRDVQNGKTKQASVKSKQIHKKVMECRKVCVQFPGLADDLLGPAYQEYAELNLFLALSKNKKLPKLDMPAKYYVLGLGDAIGELKRAGIELLAQGKLKEAERIYAELDDLSAEYSQLVYPNSLIPGLKHKQDVASKVLADFHSVIQSHKATRR